MAGFLHFIEDTGRWYGHGYESTPTRRDGWTLGIYFGKDVLKNWLMKWATLFLEVITWHWMGGTCFDSTAYFEKGGVKVAVIGQHFPYTPIANPSHLIEGWSFGIRPDEIQNVDEARGKGAEVVVLLSHNGFDVDQKLRLK